MYCESKFKYYDQILKETVPSGNFKFVDDIMEVGDFAKTTLLQLVMDHAQIFGLVPSMTTHLIQTIIENILSSLLQYCSTRTEQIHYNNDLAHQVCCFFALFFNFSLII